MSETTVAVRSKGRVVIPVEIRRRLGLKAGSKLVAMIDGDGVLLLPRTSVRSRLRLLFAGVPADLSGELVAERRAAAIEESRDG
jgi:AbrB family looped-hinge helix DNA binding protein